MKSYKEKVEALRIKDLNNHTTTVKKEKEQMKEISHAKSEALGFNNDSMSLMQKQLQNDYNYTKVMG